MNTYDTRAFGLKVHRTLTALLPVEETRRGSCLRCGQCCQFLFRCPFYDGEGCVIYSFRPPQCRKYPRTEEESIVPGCGFAFRE
ncbi:MAG: YkgJ family cysteine cluster protein [Candidatus Hydrogenedentota bacterium]|nr:MAG: YkgJ family cysteine cluster protein [Candidatus Hydrogenedentota bacterium]